MARQGLATLQCINLGFERGNQLRGIAGFHQGREIGSMDSYLADRAVQKHIIDFPTVFLI